MRAALVVHDDVLRVVDREARRFPVQAHRRRRRLPRSRRRSPLSTLPWPRSRNCSCPCAWGLVTGEAELRDGDYFGTALNRAARVMAAGHGGQILIADTTAGLLSAFRPGEFGATAITRRRESDHGSPSAGSRPADRLSAIADARLESGEPASGDDQLHRARS